MDSVSDERIEAGNLNSHVHVHLSATSNLANHMEDRPGLALYFRLFGNRGRLNSVILVEFEQ